MKTCPTCSNIIQDTAKFCPKCGANMQDAPPVSDSSSHPSFVNKPVSGRSIPPPPPGRSKTIETNSQEITSGNNFGTEALSHSAKIPVTKSKNDSGAGKHLMKLLALLLAVILIYFVSRIINNSGDSTKGDISNQSLSHTQSPTESSTDLPQSESSGPISTNQDSDVADNTQDKSISKVEESGGLAEHDSSRNPTVDSSANTYDVKSLAAQEESRKVIEMELAKAKEAAALAERALMEERRKMADDLAAKKAPEETKRSACPYNSENPLLCENKIGRYDTCSWDYAACGEPKLMRTLSKISCDGRAKSDPINEQIIVIDGCRALFIPRSK
jgi:hypothetical protein